MQLQNICTKKEYEKDGVKKIQWFKIGVLKIADSGRKYIKLFQQPDQEFFIFDNVEQSSQVESVNSGASAL